MGSLDLTLFIIMISMIILALKKEKTIDDIEKELMDRGGN